MARLGRVILGAESESGSGERSGRDATEARERASTYDERGGGKVRRPAVALGDEIGAVGRAVKDWGRGVVRCLGDDSLRGFSSSVRRVGHLAVPYRTRSLSRSLALHCRICASAAALVLCRSLTALSVSRCLCCVVSIVLSSPHPPSPLSSYLPTLSHSHPLVAAPPTMSWSTRTHTEATSLSTATATSTSSTSSRPESPDSTLSNENLGVHSEPLDARTFTSTSSDEHTDPSSDSEAETKGGIRAWLRRKPKEHFSTAASKSTSKLPVSSSSSSSTSAASPVGLYPSGLMTEKKRVAPTTFGLLSSQSLKPPRCAYRRLASARPLALAPRGAHPHLQCPACSSRAARRGRLLLCVQSLRAADQEGRQGQAAQALDRSLPSRRRYHLCHGELVRAPGTRHPARLSRALSPSLTLSCLLASVRLTRRALDDTPGCSLVVRHADGH